MIISIALNPPVFAVRYVWSSLFLYPSRTAWRSSTYLSSVLTNSANIFIRLQRIKTLISSVYISRIPMLDVWFKIGNNIIIYLAKSSSSLTWLISGFWNGLTWNSGEIKYKFLPRKLYPVDLLSSRWRFSSLAEANWFYRRPWIMFLVISDLWSLQTRPQNPGLISVSNL